MSDWAVLRAFSGKEVELQNKFDGIYCPQCLVWSKARGLRRKVPTKKPLYPGYVFAVVALAHLRDPALLGAIYFDGILARIGEEAIDFIKKKEERGSYDFTKTDSWAPEVGAVIHPLEGMFAGLSFTFRSSDGQKMTLEPLYVAGFSRIIYEGEWEGESE